MTTSPTYSFPQVFHTYVDNYREGTPPTTPTTNSNEFYLYLCHYYLHIMSIVFSFITTVVVCYVVGHVLGVTVRYLRDEFV